MKNLLLLLLTGLCLAACGIKPGDVQPPEGSDTSFPRTYPNPATDPAP